MQHIEGWVLAGQSNMEGYGLLEDPALDTDVNSNVMTLTSSGEWTVAQEPLHWLWDSYTPAHIELMTEFETESDAQLSRAEKATRYLVSRTQGAGLGIAFGKALAERHGIKVGLIPCAHGGTIIEQWLPGYKGCSSTSTETLYGAMLERVRLASEQAGFKLKGVLWYQGESDADTCKAEEYAQRLLHLVNQLRRDLRMPDLRFVIIQVGRFITSESTDKRKHWDILRDVQRTIGESLSFGGLISTIDLSLCDEIHLDTESLYRLGNRIALAAEQDFKTPRVTGVLSLGATPNNYQKVVIETEHVANSWKPGSLKGFELTDARGERLTSFWIMDSKRSTSDLKNIEILVGPQNSPLPEEICITYGLGFAPMCNAVDQADQALPVFGPIKVQHQSLIN